MEPQATGVTDGRKPGRLSPCVCSTLRMVSRAVTQMYDDILRPSGLRVTQFSILATMARSGEANLRLSFAKISSNSVDGGSCSSDRPGLRPGTLDGGSELAQPTA